jgi:excisionase family DNA binding protein
MLLSIQAAAALLQCNEETLRRAIRTGKVKAHKPAGVQRVDSDDLGLPPKLVKPLVREWREALDRAAMRELSS